MNNAKASKSTIYSYLCAHIHTHVNTYLGIHMYVSKKKQTLNQNPVLKREGKLEMCVFLLNKIKRVSLGENTHFLDHVFIYPHEVTYFGAIEQIYKIYQAFFFTSLFPHPKLDVFPLWSHALTPTPQGRNSTNRKKYCSFWSGGNF